MLDASSSFLVQVLQPTMLSDTETDGTDDGAFRIVTEDQFNQASKENRMETSG
jgi:hypothetical protein